MAKKPTKTFKPDLSDYDHKSSKNKRKGKNSAEIVECDVPNMFCSSVPYDTGNTDNDVNN